MKILAVAVLCVLAGSGTSCDNSQPVADSGVQKTSVQVPTGNDGLSAEQRNVRDRLVEDNKPGAIKHLYVISAYSGQVILYSTVKGKVTSSGKRLNPRGIISNFSQDGCGAGVNVYMGTKSYCTNEMIEDDGTYGDSVEYVYWWDVQGRYHQLYVTGGEILTVSDQPIPVKSITINIDAGTSN